MILEEGANGANLFRGIFFFETGPGGPELEGFLSPPIRLKAHFG